MLYVCVCTNDVFVVSALAWHSVSTIQLTWCYSVSIQYNHGEYAYAASSGTNAVAAADDDGDDIVACSF